MLCPEVKRIKSYIKDFPVTVRLDPIGRRRQYLFRKIRIRGKYEFGDTLADRILDTMPGMWNTTNRVWISRQNSLWVHVGKARAYFAEKDQAA